MRLASFSALLPLAATIALAGCDRHPAGSVWAEKAWVRLAAAPGRPSAGYLVVHGGDAPMRLMAITAKAAGSTELHRSMAMPAQGGAAMMTMRPVDGIDVPANGTVALAPDGYHLMLFGLAPQIKAGDTLPLTVRFARGAPLTVDAKVVAAGDAAPY